MKTNLAPVAAFEHDTIWIEGKKYPIHIQATGTTVHIEKTPSGSFVTKRLMLFVPRVALWIFILFRLKQIGDLLYRQHYFSDQVVKYFKQIAGAMLALWLIYNALSYWFVIYVKALVPSLKDNRVDLTNLSIYYLLLPLFIWMMADIFKYGRGVEEDNELTV